MTVRKTHCFYQRILLISNPKMAGILKLQVRLESPKCARILRNYRDTAVHPGWTPIGGQTQSAYVVEGTKKGDWKLSDRVSRRHIYLTQIE